MQITGNYTIVIWIAINVYLIFQIFMKDNREHILCICKMNNKERYLFLIILGIKANLVWFLVLFGQLIFVFHAKILNALVISLVQFLYAISLGAFCSGIRIKGFGLFCIGVLGIYNFICCNPYDYDAASHFFFISESVFTVNKLNLESMMNTLILTVVWFVLAYLAVRISAGKSKKAVLGVVCLFLVVYSGYLIGSSIYNQNNQKQLCSKKIGNLVVDAKGLSEKEFEDMVVILDKTEDRISHVMGTEDQKKTYTIQANYLPEILWMIKNDKVIDLSIEKNGGQINVLSPNMVYYDNPDLLESFLDYLILQMSTYNDDYYKSKYTRHLMDGYAIGIQEEIVKSIGIKSAEEVYLSERQENDEMMKLPMTEYNFIKRISYLIYMNHPDLVRPLYESVYNGDISSDEEFVDLLKTEYEEIYKDQMVEDILDRVFKE
ncbi:MAG: hypothetical protein IKS48_04675 [Eubacterium sp.]|nr:hypothetical protein [Eubacterium sp.]